MWADVKLFLMDISTEYAIESPYKAVPCYSSNNSMQPLFRPVLEHSVYIYRQAFSCNSTGVLVKKDSGEKQSEDVGGESQMA